MDTFVEISIYDSDRQNTSEAIKEVFKEIERIERVFSKFDEGSEISRISNLAGKEEVILDSEVFGLIERSIYYSKISEGSFDITVVPQKIGRYKDIILNRKKRSIRFLDEDMKMDLGGIVKGYAVDRARGVLQSYGIENALVNIGGNIFALGKPPHKNSWHVGIRDPRDKNKIIHRLSLKNRAVSTSANYERASHIIDPASGEPVESVMSVTIVADTAEKADALSTAVFVMGRDKDLKFITSIEDIEAYIYP